MLAQSKECKPFKVKCLLSERWKESKNRILVVLQHIDSEDLKSHRLLTGPAKSVLENVFKMADQYTDHLKIQDYELAYAGYNYFKTYHLSSSETRREAEKLNARRILDLVKKLKPHKVMVFGDDAAENLLPDVQDIRMFRGWPHKRKGYKCEFFTTVDFTKAYSKALDDEGENEEQQDKIMDYANLLGFISRNVGNCLYGDHVYKIDVKPRPVMVDTIPKFKKLLRKIDSKKRFSYDTETTGLERIKNLLLTMQFALDQRKGYIVPLHHKDSPFSKKEKAYIERKMEAFWSKYEDPLNRDYSRYYIGMNLKFDNTISRQQFGTYTIKRRLWDIMAGEYVLDENIKGLQNYKSGDDAGIYSMLQIELNYGSRIHYDGKFQKEEAATIKDQNIYDRKVQDYMALDVQVPWAVHDQQIERSKRIKHLNGNYEQDFRRFVVTQMSNMIHIQSIMEHRGTSTDIKWLKKLNENDGPLQEARAAAIKKLHKMKTVREANRRLNEDKGKPSNSLFGGKVKTINLDLNKQQHKIMLFINVMKLKPLGFGKDGDTPSIDKPFQERYKDKPEVALFSELSHVDKLRGSFVKAYLKRLKTDVDYAYDHKLRPSFGFAFTVTGRSNSFDPNLQQIPTRGIYAKHIKRIFAAIKGRLKIKMDYSAHEVRVWSVISGDKRLGSLFDNGRKFRRKYRKTGEEKLKLLMDTEGDIHIQNVSFFFGIPLKDIKDPKDKKIKEMRDAVKSIVFGAIYGRGASSIGNQIGKDKKYVEALLKKFFPRFPKASKWLEAAKAMPLKHQYVYGPHGRRRNLYGHLFGLDNFAAMVERRGCNSPVQALAADMGHTAAYLFGIYYEKFLQDYAAGCFEDSLDIGNIEVMVHDSLDGDFPYELYLVALQIMQWCATIGCMKYYNHHYGIKFTTALEVEFELGTDSANLTKWDWSEKQLKNIIKGAIKTQSERFKDLDEEETMKRVYAITKNRKVMKYLDTNFPVLATPPEEVMA